MTLKGSANQFSFLLPDFRPPDPCRRCGAPPPWAPGCEPHPPTIPAVKTSEPAGLLYSLRRAQESQRRPWQRNCRQTFPTRRWRCRAAPPRRSSWSNGAIKRQQPASCAARGATTIAEVLPMWYRRSTLWTVEPPGAVVAVKTPTTATTVHHHHHLVLSQKCHSTGKHDTNSEAKYE